MNRFIPDLPLRHLFSALNLQPCKQVFSLYSHFSLDLSTSSDLLCVSKLREVKRNLCYNSVLGLQQQPCVFQTSAYFRELTQIVAKQFYVRINTPFSLYNPKDHACQ